MSVTLGLVFRSLCDTSDVYDTRARFRVCDPFDAMTLGLVFESLCDPFDAMTLRLVFRSLCDTFDAMTLGLIFRSVIPLIL